MSDALFIDFRFHFLLLDDSDGYEIKSKIYTDLVNPDMTDLDNLLSDEKQMHYCNG
jgi:hypothetical protein